MIKEETIFTARKTNAFFKAADPTAYASQEQGIRAQLTINSSIDNNTMIQTGTGIHAQDDCSNTFLSCNYFDNAAPGMFLEMVSNLPLNQGSANTPTYNTWVGPYSFPLKMKIDGLSPLQQQITFWYDGIASSTNPRWPRPSPQPLITDEPITSASQFNCGLIPDIISTDSTAQESLIDSTITATIISDSLANYYREVYAFATMSEDSSYLTDALQLAFYQQKQLENIGRFNEIIAKLRIGEIDSALMINNIIVNENAIEENLKQYYQILLPTLLESAILPNAADTATMENIIYQNAYEGGDAVIRIRAYLRKIMVDHHIGLMRIINETKQNIINNVIVYPSPILGNQHLSIESNSEHIMSIEIYDAIGKKIKHVNVSNTDLKILLDISDISPGFYHIKIETESKAIFNSNFIKLW